MGYYLRGNETFAPSTVRVQGRRNQGRGAQRGSAPHPPFRLKTNLFLQQAFYFFVHPTHQNFRNFRRHCPRIFRLLKQTLFLLQQAFYFFVHPIPKKFRNFRQHCSRICMYHSLKSFTTGTALTEKVMETKEMLEKARKIIDSKKNPFPSIGLLFLCAPHPHKFSSLPLALSVKCMYPRLKSFTTETALTEKVMETKEML